jgi:hypothetical protein
MLLFLSDIKEKAGETRPFLLRDIEQKKYDSMNILLSHFILFKGRPHCSLHTAYEAYPVAFQVPHTATLLTQD